MSAKILEKWFDVDYGKDLVATGGADLPKKKICGIRMREPLLLKVEFETEDPMSSQDHRELPAIREGRKL